MKKKVADFLIRMRVPIMMVVFFLFSLVLVAQRVSLIRIGDRITYLQNEMRSTASIKSELQYEIGRLLDTDKLAHSAFEDFGLRSAKFNEIVILEEPIIEVGSPGNGPWEKVLVALTNSWETIVAGISKDKALEISGSI